ncbi:MAG: Oligopeptide ABC transporter, periplasmic oligopeptide-binding protein OppA [uncultured Thermomicrobiales bacterium]|uniref:Oligopeptide ABC transporter, periplasmic oligopeptide-binding protein OppA n=1 Tax=uncultured Thermomicrobiales bacterium TaxID=1645740 RepID=A0A6J4VPL5_9BACT|nr:MAG: Oligopeptide ABC transporter, periplasmic oligopeptide-binding protein OppA [uncultured Thermomicrobiales bacterium]
MAAKVPGAGADGAQDQEEQRMTERYDDETRRRLEAKLRERSINRRKVVQGGAAGAATVGLGGLRTFRAAAQDTTPAASPDASPMASPAASPAAGAAPTGGALDAEQVLYHFVLQDEPATFDFNSNLYANAEPECWAGLLTFDPNGTPVPDWAERFESNAEGSVWTFHLRQGNTGWTNGDPVTAHDFVWSFSRILDPAPVGAAGPNSYSFILYDVKNAESFSNATPVAREGDPLNGQVATREDLGLRAIDDWTLEVTLEGGRANFAQKVAYLACVPAHRPSVEQHGAEWALGNVPLVSNGPFKLDRWEKGVKCEFSKNENYWQAEEIVLQRVVDPITPSSNSVLAFEQGSGDQRLDWTPVAADNLPRFQEDPALAPLLKQYVYPGIWMLLPSNGVPPFDQLPVRQALSHAIDRERLTTVTNNLILPANCMVPIGVYGYIDDPEITGIQNFDPELAMSLLEGTEFAGGQNWPPITVLIRGSEEIYNSDLMLNDIIAQLQENLGMAIQIEKQTGETNFRPRLLENRDQLVWIRWWYDYPDPDNGYYDMFYGGKPAGSKRQAWSNAEFDRLCIQAKGELDPEARLELYKQAERIIQEDVGYIPVGFRVDQYAFKPWVQGVPTNRQGFTVPDGNIYLRMFTEVGISGRPAE